MPEMMSSLTKPPTFSQERAGDPRYYLNGKLYERPIPSEEPVLVEQRLAHLVAAAEDASTLIPASIASEARACEKQRGIAAEALDAYQKLDLRADEIERLRGEDFEANVEGRPANHYDTWATAFETAWREALNACNEYGYKATRFIRNCERDDESGYIQQVKAAVEPAETQTRQQLADDLAKAERTAAELSRVVATRDWFTAAARSQFKAARPLGIHPDCPEQQAIHVAQESLPPAKTAAKARAAK